MANIDFFKNPDSFEVYVTVKFGTWKVAEIKRFPSPTDILHGNIIEYTENKHMCSEKDIKEIEEFTINNVINTIFKMRTLSKGNYRVVYDPAKDESMSMIAVYKKNLDGTLSLINKEMGEEKDNEVLREQAMKIINELK